MPGLVVGVLVKEIGRPVQATAVQPGRGKVIGRVRSQHFVDQPLVLRCGGAGEGQALLQAARCMQLLQTGQAQYLAQIADRLASQRLSARVMKAS